jgi:hypothetical protein
LQDKDAVQPLACVAWAFYSVSRARKLEPVGPMCHYCHTTLARNYDIKSVELKARLRSVPLLCFAFVFRVVCFSSA